MYKLFVTLIIVPAIAAVAINCSKNPTDSGGSLSGVVTFEAQTDHGGIVVNLLELNRHTTTNTSGSYSFSAIPSGSYTILASDGDTLRHLFDFALLEDVSVTAGRSTTAEAMELPLFQRLVSDVTGQVNWTTDGGPYLVTRSLTVQPGARLNIEAGAIIKFEGYHRLTIKGQLIARGTATDSVFFTSMRTEGAPGDWDRISIEGPTEDLPDSLMNCHIRHANIGVSSSQVSLVIRESSICQCSGYGLVSTASTLDVCRSLFKDNYGGISCENGSNGTVQTNIFESNDFVGIACKRSSPQICDNIISASKYGLHGQSESDPLIWHNHFSSNEIAVYLFYYCDPQIEANSFSDQQRFGLHLVGYNRPQIHFNNILLNGDYNIFMKDQPQNIQAENNWWNTTNSDKISALIWDGKDDTRLGVAFITPFLDAPVDTAGPRIIF